MGKTAALVRARERASRQVRERRVRRSTAERDKRRAHASAAHSTATTRQGGAGVQLRTVRHTVTSNSRRTAAAAAGEAKTAAGSDGTATATTPSSLPSRDEAAMLCAQFAQAARLAATAHDVCALLRHYAAIADDDEDGVVIDSTAAAAAAEADNDDDAHDVERAATTRRKRVRAAADNDNDNTATTTAATAATATAHTVNVTALHSFAAALLRTADTPATAEDDEDDEVANEQTTTAAAAAGDDDDDDDVETQLHAILCDESGWRVVATLLRALAAAQMHDDGAAVARCVLAAYEEDEHLAAHHTACRVLRALVDYADDDDVRMSVLLLLRQHTLMPRDNMTVATNAADIVNDDDNDDDDDDGEVARVRALLCDRHTAVTVTALLRSRAAAATAAWLCDALGLTSNENNSETTATAAADDDKVTSVVLALVEHAVACHVMRQLLHSSAVARRAVLRRVCATHLHTLLSSKRGVAFLTDLLSAHEHVNDVSDDGDDAVTAADKDNGSNTKTSNKRNKTTDANSGKSSSSSSNAGAAAAGDDGDEAAAVLEAVLPALSPRLPALCVDARANFVVQRLLSLARHTRAARAPQYLTRILQAMTATTGTSTSGSASASDGVGDGGKKQKKHTRGSEAAMGSGDDGGKDEASALRALAMHPLGVHVVLALVDVALALPTSTVAAAAAAFRERVAAALVTRATAATLLRDRYGSLVLRRLMPIIAVTSNNDNDNKKSTTSSPSGALLRTLVEQQLPTLMYDATGNMVVQAYLAHAGAAACAALTRQLLLRNNSGSGSDVLRGACVDAAASHVVCAVLAHADAATRTALCTALRGLAVDLATHLHGRFIVEAALPLSRELREALLSRFAALAQAKGTQHVLCALVAHADPRSRAALVRAVASSPSQLRALATTQCGSIALQRLMQSSDEFARGVAAALAHDARLRDELAQHFYGRYVVQLAA